MSSTNPIDVAARSLARLWRVPLAALLLLWPTIGCDVTWNQEWYYENGQLMVVEGSQGNRGEREGAWCYFHEDGTIMLTEKNEYGLMDRTGFYENDKKVRDLTHAELMTAQADAAQKTQEYRERASR